MSKKEKIISSYIALGLRVDDNKVLNKLILYLDEKDSNLREQFELYHMDFLLSMKRIKEFDSKSFEYYLNRINKIKNETDYWGERFEIYFFSKLILANKDLNLSLKRGKEGKQPDFVITYNNSLLGIELTTLKFSKLESSFDKVMTKITDVILDKNKKDYASPKSMLIVDVTNLVSQSLLHGYSLKRRFTENFKGFSYIKTKIKYGMIVFCNSEFRRRQDNSLYHILKPYFGLIDDNGEIDRDLKSFSFMLFDNFDDRSDYEFSYSHPNI